MIKRNNIWKTTLMACLATAGVLWLGCSTESPTAPKQDAAFPVQSVVKANFSCTVLSDSVTIQFVNLSTGYVTSVLWDFGDGAKSRDVNPVHTYASSGPFIVILKATGGGSASTVQAAVPDACASGDTGGGGGA